MSQRLLPTTQSLEKLGEAQGLASLNPIKSTLGQQRSISSIARGLVRAELGI